MAKNLTADDILPLVACLTPKERVRLLQLIKAPPDADPGGAYRTFPVTPSEFSSDDEQLSWDAAGWEDVG